jgi:hypothetical protein
MDHPCHKCGQPVEDGVPFCAHCAAPQIRVILPEPVPAVAGPAGEGAIAATEPGTVAARVATSFRSERSQIVVACALGAVIATLALGLRIIPGIGMLSAGFLSVAFYRRGRPGDVVRVSSGALLGVVSGIFAFLLCISIGALAIVVFHAVPDARTTALDVLKQTAAMTKNPDVLATYESLKAPERGTELVLFVLLAFFFAFILFAGLGGILGALILGRRGRR